VAERKVDSFSVRAERGSSTTRFALAKQCNEEARDGRPQ
jgi:hypothetical protein